MRHRSSAGGGPAAQELPESRVRRPGGAPPRRSDRPHQPRPAAERTTRQIRFRHARKRAPTRMRSPPESQTAPNIRIDNVPAPRAGSRNTRSRSTPKYASHHLGENRTSPARTVRPPSAEMLPSKMMPTHNGASHGHHPMRTRSWSISHRIRPKSTARRFHSAVWSGSAARMTAGARSHSTKRLSRGTSVTLRL